MIFKPKENCDVSITYSDNTNIEKRTGYKMEIPLKYGLGEFIDWYKNYYN